MDLDITFRGARRKPTNNGSWTNPRVPGSGSWSAV